jgi:hypothetical protein
MDVKAFLSTVYVGDRACKSITIDAWNTTVRVQIDCISRIRSPSGTWDYYVDEDIRDGFLVFEEVQQCELRNAGYLPNDAINSIEVVETQDDVVTIDLSIDSVDEEAYHHETVLRVTCKAVHLEDPAHPGFKIIS